MDKKKSAGWKALERAKEKDRKNQQDTVNPPMDGSFPNNHPGELIGKATIPKTVDPWNTPIKKSAKRKEAFKLNPIYRSEFEAAFQSYRESLPNNRVADPYLDLESFQSSDEAEELCQRWRLSFALHPDDELWDDPPDYAIAIFEEYCLAVKVLPYGKAIRKSFPLRWISDGVDRVIPYRKAKPFPSPPQETALKKIVSRAKLTLHLIKKTRDRRPWLREGRYLRVEIDLSQSQGQIEAEIKSLLEELRHLVSWTVNPPRQPIKIFTAPPPSEDLPDDEWFKQIQAQKYEKRKFQKDQLKPKRKPSLNINLSPEPPGGPITIFQVWVMNKKERKSAWQITKELWPNITSKYPQFWEINEDTEKLSPKDKQARNYLRKIERAIEKAQEEIDSINPTE